MLPACLFIRIRRRSQRWTCNATSAPGTKSPACRCVTSRLTTPTSSATYSLQADGKVRVQNRALDGNGEPQESIGEATVVPASGNAKLEVTFLPDVLRWIPFTKGDYWVLRIDDDYQTALVGGPDRKYLWLLSRSPALDATTSGRFPGHRNRRDTT